MAIVRFAFLSLCLFAANIVSCKSHPAINNRPIIGVIAVDISNKLANNGRSHLPASYVKFLESAGARVVPIMIYKPMEYYTDIFSKINGVLFPGGANILASDGYGRTGKILFNLAVQANDEGDYFPLWGTCLGFELLNYLAANRTNWMKACSAEDVASTLQLMPGYNDTRMFANIDHSMSKILQNYAVTINYHQWCVTPQNFTDAGLDRYYKILSLSKDSSGMAYLSAIEAHKYPFYGVAFHPEKVSFEWVFKENNRNIPHTKEAIIASQYFGNFFVNEARKNRHSFPSKASEDEVLIYRYQPVFTGLHNSSTEQNYFFP